MTVEQPDDTPRRSKRKLAFLLIAIAAPVWMVIGFGVYNLRTAYECLLTPSLGQDVSVCEDALQRPLALGPLHGMLAMKLADVHKAKGATDAAKNVLSAELKRDEENAMVRDQLAAMLRDEADHQAAAQNYLILHKAYPGNQHYFTNAITSLSESGRAAEAVALAKPIAEKRNDAWSWEWLGWAEQKAENYDASAIAYGKASALDPTQQHLLAWQGYSLEKAGKNEEALLTYGKAIELSKTAENIAYRITLNTKLGKLDAVRADHELILSVDPSAANKVSFARFLIDIDDYAKADDLLASARVSEPTDYGVLDQSVRVKILMGDFPAAAKALEAFKAIKPDDVDVVYWQAYLDDEMGEDIKAIAGYKKALETWPDWSMLHTSIGNSLIDAKLPQVSLHWFDKAIELDPGGARPLTGRARAYLYLNLPTRALADADAALKLDQRNGMAHARRAQALADLNRKTDALAAYDAALRLIPRAPWIREDYALLLTEMGQSEKAETVRAQGKAL